MDGSLGSLPDQPAGRSALLGAIHAVMPAIAARAAGRDATAAFPREEFDLLRRCGALIAPLPCCCGGLGMGTSGAAAADTAAMLRLIGEASLPVGRVFEGHVNALRLICRLGSAEQVSRTAAEVADGHLFGVWNTDPADAPLRIGHGTLFGAKVLASGAGLVTRALVTAAGDKRPLLLVRLDPHTRVDLSSWTAQGMRASATGRVDFDGLSLSQTETIGAPGDYLAQPDFSGGAWRVLAVQLGGLNAILAEVRTMLRARERSDDPSQLARFGATLIATETAHLFVGRAAQLAEADDPDPGAVVAYVGLARIAVETSCLDAIRLAQRSIGLAAFMRPLAIERICRDLATYLRQPAPDETLREAAAFFMQAPLPR